MFASIVFQLINQCLLHQSACIVNKLIPFYLNIPLFGFFILRGKSACCQKPLSLQYPIVEALAGVGALYLGLIYGVNIESVLLFFFYLSLVIIFFTDLNDTLFQMLLPYSLSIVGF
jgi:leader peptidase (prepilin peptidase)/N-methyltransferase